MRKYFVIMAAIAAALLAVSCNKEQNTPDEPQQIVAGEQITITASIPAELSKVDLAYTGSALQPTWATGDKIRVADHSNASNYQDFTLSAGEGTQNGTFTGTAVSATSYDITIVNAKSWPANVLAQTQAEDESTAHLGYTVALTGVNTYEDIAFTSAWASSKGGTIAQSGALHLSATLPSGVAAKVNKVTMIADQKIFGSTGTMVINITTPKDNGTANTIDVYASVPASGVSIPSGTLLLFQFGTTDGEHSVYTRYYKTDADITLAGGQLSKITLDHTKAGKFFEGDGTASHPYLIADKYQLASISVLLSTESKKYFKLVDNIAVSSWTSINCKEKGAIDLDGNNKSITGLNKPLFEFFNGQVSDLTLSDATLSATGSNYYGVLARTVDGANSCELTNVSVINSSVTAKGTIGGLVGKIDSSTPCTLTNCSAEVDVTGTGYYLGGLVGQVTNGTLTHCSATGDVSTSTYYASGLVGYIHGTVSIEKCYATGDIEPTVDNTVANTGGIVGYMDDSADLTILNCYYAGTIGTDTYKHRRWSGGILGRTVDGSKISVTNCYASFFVKTGNANVDGALVGYSGSSSVTCSGYVGWSSFSKMAGTGTTVSADGNYLGTEGTISAKAKEFGWDANIWDLTGDVPVLK